jgi:hypothetical protein
MKKRFPVQETTSTLESMRMETREIALGRNDAVSTDPVRRRRRRRALHALAILPRARPSFLSPSAGQDIWTRPPSSGRCDPTAVIQTAEIQAAAPRPARSRSSRPWRASPSQDANTRREDARASPTPPRCATASSARRPSETSYSPRSSSLTMLLAATSRAGEEGERVLCASSGGRPGVQDPVSVPVHAAPATSRSLPGGSSSRPARTHMAPRVSRRAGARRGPRTNALADAAGQ